MILCSKFFPHAYGFRKVDLRLTCECHIALGRKNMIKSYDGALWLSVQAQNLACDPGQRHNSESEHCTQVCVQPSDVTAPTTTICREKGAEIKRNF